MKAKALSADLEALIRNPDKQKFSLGDFVSTAKDRAFGLVLLVLALPSALPIPATGISTPLGIGIFFVGLQMIAGRSTLWLPEKIMRLQINRSLAIKLVQGLSWILKRFEKIVRPRMHWLGSRSGNSFLGVLVALLALVMQAPIPLTNTLPAAVIFCLAVCQTEEDGLLGVFSAVLGIIVILGYIAGFVALLFFGLQGLEEFIPWIQSHLR